MSLTEKVVIKKWDDDADKAVETVTTLEEIIRNPNGFEMESVGLMLFNIERKKLGLTVYKKNYRSGTYDEVSK
jgi:hypothetical protein